MAPMVEGPASSVEREKFPVSTRCRLSPFDFPHPLRPSTRLGQEWGAVSAFRAGDSPETSVSYRDEDGRRRRVERILPQGGKLGKLFATGGRIDASVSWTENFFPENFR